MSTPAAIPVTGAVPPDVLVVISAAIAATLGPGARIVSVRTVRTAPIGLLQPWSVEGRRDIYASHRFR